MSWDRQTDRHRWRRNLLCGGNKRGKQR